MMHKLIRNMRDKSKSTKEASTARDSTTQMIIILVTTNIGRRQ